MYTSESGSCKYLIALLLFNGDGSLKNKGEEDSLSINLVGELSFYKIKGKGLMPLGEKY